jgi:uncharacterized protein YaiI (UPF0178 family)
LKIIVDADACPGAVKDLLFKTSERLQLELWLIANQPMRVPQSSIIKSIVVSAGADVADDHIVEVLSAGDLIISADIPLADRVVKKGGFVLDPRGSFITQENIGQRLAMRNLMDDLRTQGMDTGGPPAFSNRDKQEFARQLDQFLTRVLKTKK